MRFVIGQTKPLTREECLKRAHEARRARPITAVESRRRFELVERLLASDVSPAAMLRVCRTQLQMTAPAVERTKTKVFAAWSIQDAELRSYRRYQVRKRLLRVIARAAKEDDWRAVIAAETLLAKIDGLISPEKVRVDVNAAVGDGTHAALIKVLGGMGEAQFNGLLREYEELERRAALAPLQ